MTGLDKFLKSSPQSQKGSDSKIDEKSPKKGKKPGKQSNRKESESDSPQIVEKNINEEFSSEETLEEGENAEKINPSPSNSKFLKHQLKCPNKKCNYQRILMKSSLVPSDFTCPKCGTEMQQRSK